MLLGLITLFLSTSNPDAYLDREYTLRLPQSSRLLMEFDRQIRDTLSVMATIFPRPCKSNLDSSQVCNDEGGLNWIDSTRKGDIKLHPVIGLETRESSTSETFSSDVGIRITGGIAQASFYLDARIFSNFEPQGTPSPDGEYVERQVDGQASHFTYNSFSRYRSRLSIETPIGRVSAGRETQNWGPSVYNALVLSQSSVPYNQLDWTIDLGPFTVRSLVADLAIQGPGQSKLTEDTRTLFAHRYEWRVNTAVLIGISEALVLYNRSAPICFLPLVPLFAQKGLWYENINNGELAIDLSWKVKRGLRVYGEFLIDDMNSPTTLFDNSWKSKWASIIGAQIAFVEASNFRSGALIEWSRIEPWVYSHYVANTSQALNQGLPLGNSLGPNSQNVIMNIYAKTGAVKAGVEGKLLWKGVDKGSIANDTLHDNNTVVKKFLTDSDFGMTIGPNVEWERNGLAVSAGFALVYNENVVRRIYANKAANYRVRIEYQY